MPRFIRRRPIDLDALKQRAFQRRRSAMIEQLERRTLLAITIDSAGIVHLDGSERSDVMYVSYRESEFFASIDHEVASFAVHDVSGFELNGFASGDSFNVRDISSAPGPVRPVILNGHDGDDRFYLHRDSSETVNGGAGNDFIRYEAGNALDGLSGGSGIDSVRLMGVAPRGLDLNAFPDVENAQLYAGTLTGNGLSNVLGLEAGGTILGNAGDDRLVGGSLADTLDGGDGNDTLIGLGGRDSLLGGNHDDLIYAQDNEIDTVNGGAGFDRAQRDSSDSISSVEAFLTNPSESVYIQERILHVDGTAGNDTIQLEGGIHSSEEADITLNGVTSRFHQDTFDRILIRGFAGNDSLVTLATYDTVFEAGDGDDDTRTEDGEGAQFATVFGGAGNDIVEFDVDSFSSILAPFDGGTGRDKVIRTADGGHLDLRDFPTVEDGVLEIFGNLTGNALDNHLTHGGTGQIFGGDGNDTLDSSASPDWVRLAGENGNDLLIGNSHEDEFLTSELDGGAGNDTLQPGTGPEILRGGAGTDEVTYASRTAALRITLDGVANDGETGENDNVFSDIERIRGGSGNDWIDGNSAGNILYGNAGNDTLVGFGGNDALFGGIGNDRIYGGSGDDYIEGNAGNDSLHGEAGLDQLRGHDGDDWLYTRDDLADTLDGGAGYDRADVDAIDSTTSIEEFLSEPQPDDNIYMDSAGVVHGIGTAGEDELSVDFAEAGMKIIVTVNDDSQLFNTADVTRVHLQGLAGNDRFDTFSSASSVPAVHEGGDGDDMYVATGAPDSFLGGNGNDVIMAGSADDVPDFDGGAGLDTIHAITGPLDLRLFPTIEGGVVESGTLHGNALDNVLQLFAGNGAVYGLGGNDHIHFDSAFGDSTPYLDGGDGNDVIVAITAARATLVGGAGHDRLSADNSLGYAEPNHFEGGTGNDSIFGNYGDDIIFGGAGDDHIRPWRGNDYADGGDGNDYIEDVDTYNADVPRLDDTFVGGAGIDTLITSIGNDQIDASDGDVVQGQDGNDVINFTASGPATLTLEGGLRAGDIDTLNINSGSLTFDSDLSATTANLVINGADDASVTFNSTQHLHALNLADGAVATMPANGDRFLFTRGLSIAGTGKLDLADNDLLWDYTGDSPYLTARDWVATGRGGASGITSSTSTGKTVLALVDNAVYGRNSWNGQDIDETTLIGKYTYYGDSNLDGKVTGDDYVAIDSNLGKTDAQWIHGDFNFDGRTSGDDYVSIDANLGMGTTDPASFDEMQAEMVTIHADSYGGKSYVKEVEEAAGEKVKRKPTRPEKRGRR